MRIEPIQQCRTKRGHQLGVPALKISHMPSISLTRRGHKLRPCRVPSNVKSSSNLRREITHQWLHVVIPALSTSTLSDLRQTGSRLMNEWKSQEHDREALVESRRRRGAKRQDRPFEASRREAAESCKRPSCCGITTPVR